MAQLTAHFHKRRLTEDQNLFVREGDFILYGKDYYEIIKTIDSLRDKCVVISADETMKPEVGATERQEIWTKYEPGTIRVTRTELWDAQRKKRPSGNSALAWVEPGGSTTAKRTKTGWEGQ